MQDEDSLDFVDDKNVLKYIKMIHTTVNKPKFEQKFSNISKDVIELLKSMLKFNPEERLTAAECIKLPIFDSIRNKDLEKQATTTVKLPLDDELTIDYDTCTDNKTLKEVIEVLDDEIKQFQKIQKK